MEKRHDTEARPQDLGVISIWGLLVWTFRRQQAWALLQRERQGAVRPGGYGADSLLRAAQASTLGYVQRGGVVEAAVSLPGDARVVARYVEALPPAERQAVIATASDGVQPVRPEWSAPRLEPEWQLYKGGQRPRTVRFPRRHVACYCPLVLTPDPEPLLRQDRAYRRWWRTLQVLDRVIAHEEAELQGWRLSRVLPPEPEPLPAWATGWVGRT